MISDYIQSCRILFLSILLVAASVLGGSEEIKAQSQRISYNADTIQLNTSKAIAKLIKTDLAKQNRDLLIKLLQNSSHFFALNPFYSKEHDGAIMLDTALVVYANELVFQLFAVSEGGHSQERFFLELRYIADSYDLLSNGVHGLKRTKPEKIRIETQLLDSNGPVGGCTVKAFYTWDAEKKYSFFVSNQVTNNAYITLFPGFYDVFFYKGGQEIKHCELVVSVDISNKIDCFVE